MSDLPTRPPSVYPCPECGGKTGHVPNCETAAIQARDWNGERVDALRGRTVESIMLLGHRDISIMFTDGVRLNIDYRQIDFARQGLVLTVTTAEERERKP